jgi:hypothetical protein
MSHLAYTNPDHIYQASESAHGTSVYFELAIYQSDLTGFTEAGLAGAIKSYLYSLSPDGVTAQKVAKSITSL